MTGYSLKTALDRPFDDVVPRVREALAQQGFGVLTEIDVRATMKAKLGLDVPAQLILGACRPQLAHRALRAAPSLGVLLPCNVVVRAEASGGTVVEVIDPHAMTHLEDSPVVLEVADEARERLVAALDALAASERPDEEA